MCQAEGSERASRHTPRETDGGVARGLLWVIAVRGPVAKLTCLAGRCQGGARGSLGDVARVSGSASQARRRLSRAGDVPCRALNRQICIAVRRAESTPSEKTKGRASGNQIGSCRAQVTRKPSRPAARALRGRRPGPSRNDVSCTLDSAIKCCAEYGRAARSWTRESSVTAGFPECLPARPYQSARHGPEPRRSPVTARVYQLGCIPRRSEPANRHHARVRPCVGPARGWW